MVTTHSTANKTAKATRSKKAAPDAAQAANQKRYGEKIVRIYAVAMTMEYKNSFSRRFLYVYFITFKILDVI